MPRSFDAVVQKFNAVIGEVQRIYAELSDNQQENIADFQAGLLAVYNKKTTNQSIGEFLTEVGLKDSLYAIRDREALDEAKKRSGVTDEDVTQARETVNSKAGLSWDVPGYAKIGMTLGYISPKAGDLCMEAQAYIRALQHINGIEAALANKPTTESGKEAIDSFSLKLVSELTGKETPQEVLNTKQYARVNGDRDPDGVKLAQITMVLADVYASRLKNDLLFQNDLSLPESYIDNFKQEIAKGMGRTANEFVNVDFNQAADDLLTVRENIHYTHDNESGTNVYTNLPNTLQLKAFENARFLEEKLGGFTKAAEVAHKNISGSPHP